LTLTFARLPLIPLSFIFSLPSNVCLVLHTTWFLSIPPSLALAPLLAQSSVLSPPPHQPRTPTSLGRRSLFLARRFHFLDQPTSRFFSYLSTLAIPGSPSAPLLGSFHIRSGEPLGPSGALWDIPIMGTITVAVFSQFSRLTPLVRRPPRSPFFSLGVFRLVGSFLGGLAFQPFFPQAGLPLWCNERVSFGSHLSPSGSKCLLTEICLPCCNDPSPPDNPSVFWRAHLEILFYYIYGSFCPGFTQTPLGFPLFRRIVTLRLCWQTLVEQTFLKWSYL